MVEALAAGKTQGEAAKYAGVNQCTVSGWMQTEWFTEALGLVQAERRRAVLLHIDALVPDAVAALGAILRRSVAEDTSKAPRDSDAIKAAAEVLDRTGVLKGAVHVVKTEDGITLDDLDALLAEYDDGAEAVTKLRVVK